MNRRGDRGAIGLAERLLAVLEEGGFTATYKYAVLLGLMDVCMERTDRHGAAPDVITTRQLAERVTELYWPHAVPYLAEGSARVLRQNAVGRTQAEIVSRIRKFRESHAPDPTATLASARLATAKRYETLVRFVEWKLIEMPLPRFQRLGKFEDRFLYEIGWDQSVSRPAVQAYQRGDGDAFDNRILLLPGAGEHLVSLNGLLRPLVHRRWAAMIARINGLEDARLEAFLFGSARVPTAPVRGFLRDEQEGLCFYCRERLRGKAEVDHFIPWARYPDNGLDNLVLAHEGCNRKKRHHLAWTGHLERWVGRVERLQVSTSLRTGLTELGWERDAERTMRIGRAVYLRLPEGARLWVRGDEFRLADQDIVRKTFRS